MRTEISRVAARAAQGFRGEIYSDAEISVQDLQRWLKTAKYIVATHGTQYAPIIAKIEGELAKAEYNQGLREAGRKLKSLMCASPRIQPARPVKCQGYWYLLRRVLVLCSAKRPAGTVPRN